MQYILTTIIGTAALNFANNLTSTQISALLIIISVVSIIQFFNQDEIKTTISAIIEHFRQENIHRLGIHDANIVENYLLKHSDILSKPLNTCGGVLHNQHNSSITKIMPNQKRSINDTKLNFKGVLHVYTKILTLHRPIYNDDDTCDSVEYKVECTSINIISKCAMSSHEYIQKILNYDNEQKNNTYKLYGYIVGKRTIHYCWFNMNKKDYSAIQDDLRESIYHNNRKNILEKIDMAVQCIKSPYDTKFVKHNKTISMNMLLHGPPGTGKSTIIDVIAKLTGSDIAYLNFAEMSKTRLIEILCHNSQQYCYPPGDDNRYFIRHCKNNFMIVIEEIDLQLNKCQQLYDNYLQHKTARDNNNDNDSAEKNNNDYTGIIPDELLPIIQGYARIPGQIIIATTNNYQALVDRWPALVREGRLTPIETNYLCLAEQNRMITNYTGHQNVLQEPVNYCTAKLSDICIRCAFYKWSRQQLIDELRR